MTVQRRVSQTDKKEDFTAESHRVSPKKELIDSAEFGVLGELRWKNKNLLCLFTPLDHLSHGVKNFVPKDFTLAVIP